MHVVSMGTMLMDAQATQCQQADSECHCSLQESHGKRVGGNFSAFYGLLGAESSSYSPVQQSYTPTCMGVLVLQKQCSCFICLAVNTVAPCAHTCQQSHLMLAMPNSILQKLSIPMASLVFQFASNYDLIHYWIQVCIWSASRALWSSLQQNCM